MGHHIANDQYLKTDEDFDTLYPLPMQRLAGRHWTRLRIAALASDFLAMPGSKVLDIGSGVGKFCLAGAYRHPDVQFVGVEQRSNLVDHALRAQRTLGVHNVTFIHGNFTDVDLRDFDHLYFYNSFYENVHREDPIDTKIDHSIELYHSYEQHLYNGLRAMPNGTRMVTYHARLQEVPKSYHLEHVQENGDLKFWMKG